MNNNLSYIFNTTEDINSLLETLRKYENHGVRHLHSFNYLDIPIKTVISLVEKNIDMSLKEIANLIYNVIHN